MKIILLWIKDAWVPLKNDGQQYIQVDLREHTPVYGLEVAGSVDLNSYVTSLSILYSDDDHLFSYVEENGKPKVIPYPENT